MTPGLRLVPGALFARDYRIQKHLANGGMGAVYAADQLSTGKVRALKILHPEVCSDPRIREQFVQEARVGGSIGSGHVVEVVGAGIDEATGLPWLAMELLEGEDLGALVSRAGALPHGDVRVILEQLGAALGAAHAAGIVHRDLKPENLFLCRSRLQGMPFLLKVLDFGIARLVTRSPTAASVTTAIGSPLWLAPEQAQTGSRLSPGTDVWSLGLLAYHLLTGKYFWKTAGLDHFNLTALLYEVTLEPIVPASVRAAEQGVLDRLPQGFDAWFARCVVREQSERFPDGGQACLALASLLDPTRSSLLPASSPQPTRRLTSEVVPSRPSLPFAATQASLQKPRPRWVVPASAAVFLAAMAGSLALGLALWRRKGPPSCADGNAAQCLADGERLVPSRAQRQGRVGDRGRRGGRTGRADLTRASELFQRACQLGSMEGCSRQADLLTRGRGLQRDYARAIALYEQACTGRRQESCVALGRLLTDGRGVVPDRVRAVTLYLRACDGGLAEGCVRLGVALRDGAGVAADRARAARLFQQGCNEDHAEGCLELAKLRLRGPGLRLDTARGLALLDRACGVGSGEGCALLGERYEQGRGVARSQPRATEAFQQARTHLRSECDERRHASCVMLGTLHAEGRGGPADQAQANELYQRAGDALRGGCERGTGYRCALLAELYATGRGVPIDPQQAAALNEQACESGEVDLCVTLGETYREGRGVVRDEVRALRLERHARDAYQQACGRGDVGRCFDLAKLAERGRGGPANRELTLSLYRLVCRAGDHRGCTGVGDVLRQYGPGRDITAAEASFQTSCEGSDPHGCFGLGALREGEGRHEEALAHYQRACDRGDPEGCRVLAQRFLEPVGGLAPDPARAALLLGRACDADDYPSCQLLAERLERGDPGFGRDPVRARLLHRVACAGGLMTACDRRSTEP